MNFSLRKYWHNARQSWAWSFGGFLYQVDITWEDTCTGTLCILIKPLKLGPEKSSGQKLALQTFQNFNICWSKAHALNMIGMFITACHSLSLPSFYSFWGNSYESAIVCWQSPAPAFTGRQPPQQNSQWVSHNCLPTWLCAVVNTFWLSSWTTWSTFLHENRYQFPEIPLKSWNISF